MMTGLNPANTGSRFNAIPVMSSIKTLPSIYKDKGSITSAFVSAYPVSKKATGLAKDFVSYDDFQVHPRSWANLRRNSLFYHLSCLYGLRVGQSNGDATLAKTRGWLDIYKGSSFFLWFHLYDPHTPYTPPEEYARDFTKGYKQSRIKTDLFTIFLLNEKRIIPTKDDLDYIKGLYAGECCYTDWLVGRLVSDLKAYGLYDKALIIIAGDHGESLDEHGYYFSHGLNLFEESVRVPLIIKFPDNAFKGKVVNRLVSLVDIYPTVLDYLKIEKPSRLDGVSLMPVIKDGNYNNKRILFIESGSELMVGVNSDRVLEELRLKKYALVTEDSLKLILTPDGNYSLFDLREDRLEQSVVRLIPDTLRNALYKYKRKSHSINISEYIDKDRIKQLKSLGYIN